MALPSLSPRREPPARQRERQPRREVPASPSPARSAGDPVGEGALWVWRMVLYRSIKESLRNHEEKLNKTTKTKLKKHTHCNDKRGGGFNLF